MHVFPQLDIDCVACPKYKITKSITSPGVSTNTKNPVTVGRNNILTSPSMCDPKSDSDIASSIKYSNDNNITSTIKTISPIKQTSYDKLIFNTGRIDSCTKALL